MQLIATFPISLYYFIKRNRWNAMIIIILLGVIVLSLVQSASDYGVTDLEWWSGLWQNFGTEMVGAIMTFILIEILINSIDRKNTLIRQMGSQDNITARYAVNELRELGYLFDGALRGKSLQNANLQGANLKGAKLVSTDLMGANLQGATLDGIKMNRKTRLPDGAYWQSTTDLMQYTHPHKEKPTNNRPSVHYHRYRRTKRR